jgi:hypothetical protein
MKKITKFLFVLSLIVFNTPVTDAQTFWSEYVKQKLTRLPEPTHAEEVRQNNEIVASAVGQDVVFHSNPLLINGQSLNYNSFDLMSKGVLTVVRGNPEAENPQLVPFYVSIRRDGKFVQDKKMPFLNKAFFKMNLSEIFPFTKEGDVMIIHPAQAEDWKAKRVLKLLRGGGC